MLDTLGANAGRKPKARHKWMRRLGCGVVGLVALYGLFVGVENWRGDRAWERYLEEMESKGEAMDREAILPPAVPDEENFATAPLFRWLFERANIADDNSSRGRDVEIQEALATFQPFRPDDERDWREGVPVDMGDWQRQFRVQYPEIDRQADEAAREILLQLGRYDTVLAALREAASRPESRFPLNYQNAPRVQFFVMLRKLAMLTQMRALCELSLGESDRAYNDFRLNLRLVESIESDPTAVSLVFSIALREAAIQPLWEGISRHQWSDSQLAELQVEFARQNFAHAYQRAMRGDRLLFSFPIVDKLEDQRAIEAFTREDMAWNVLLNFSTKGWFKQNKVSLGRWYQALIETVDGERVRFHPERLAAAEASLLKSTGLNSKIYGLFARQTATSTISVQYGSAGAQSTNDLALTAITLERYWLRHGRYPATLDEIESDQLAPGRGIPSDCITGNPPHYALQGDSFVLYYEGWDGRDDGGKMASFAARNLAGRPKEGDWIWPQMVQQ